MTAATRKIIHVDADCFFAAVEIRDNPALRGRPVAVGGDPGRRGVICTCSYEARAAGVRSAMPSARAQQLCPELIFIKPDFDRYRAAARAIRAVFADFSDTIEPLSLDEAYLEIPPDESATRTAQAIKQRIARELQLTVSAGVAPVKFLAKIASDWRKPDGLFTIAPAEVEDFCARLPVNKLPGVGPVTRARLERLGLRSGLDVRLAGAALLTRELGSFGQQLLDRAWGRDDRPVSAERERKSLSVEHTYGEDRTVAELPGLVPGLLERLQQRFAPLTGSYRAAAYFVKLKFDDFGQTTLETTLPKVWELPPADAYGALLERAWQRGQRNVRLVGLGVRLAPRAELSSMVQLPLFAEL